jgi:hypothetical protein
MKKKIFLTSIFVLLGVYQIFACSCAISPLIEDEIKNADLVFTGTLMGSGIDNQRAIETFSVAKVYKGASVEKIHLYVDLNMPCGKYSFEIGKSYLVFANKQEDGTFFADICSRTKPLTDAADDLKVLNNQK